MVASAAMFQHLAHGIQLHYRLMIEFGVHHAAIGREGQQPIRPSRRSALRTRARLIFNQDAISFSRMH